MITPTVMLHPSDEERLSAYFDEELSSDECAEVERLLRDNPAARTWLEQVEDLHAELQSLPKFQLEADFADGVMRRAEREMLREREAREPCSREHNSSVHERNGAATHDAAPTNNDVVVSLAVNLSPLEQEVRELHRPADALPTLVPSAPPGT